MKNALAVCLFMLAILWPTPAAASGEGLRISPVRQFPSVDTGATERSQFTVTNLTSKPLPITLSIQQFSVADYTYDYAFDLPDNDWMRLGVTETVLKPGESQDIPFALVVPDNARPGGHYYTLLASADLSAQGLSGTIQAADLLYVTVNGELTRTSRLQGNSIRQFSFGRDISFVLQPLNTGNVHQFVYVSGQLHGLTAKPESASGTHLLLPEKVRTVPGSIPAPVLPGIYRATYGYRTDAGQTVAASAWIVFIPPWFVAILLGLLLLAGKFLPRRKAKSPPKTTAPPRQT